jgi:hypothetical protein
MEEKVFYNQRVAKDLECNGPEKSRCEERTSTIYLCCQMFGWLVVIWLKRGEKGRDDVLASQPPCIRGIFDLEMT